MRQGPTENFTNMLNCSKLVRIGFEAALLQMGISQMLRGKEGIATEIYQLDL